MRRKKRFFIGGTIVFLAVGYLGYMGFVGGATYFYTVGEVLEQGNSIYGENVRVKGQVVPGSLEQEAQGTILRFTIVDIEREGSLPVVFQGVVPDTFKEDNEVIIEGKLDSTGVFQAHTLMPQCASRYVPE